MCPTVIDLESELETLNPILSGKLAQIKTATSKIWNPAKLRWYTDHGTSHSQSIIRLIGEIIEYLYKKQFNVLSDDELFVLLASCYLHDIGMQDLRIDGKTSENLQPQDFKLIRKLHPRRSSELIRGGVVDIGGRDGIVNLEIDHDYLEAIMIISEAHGSEYFDKAVLELELNPPAPGNKQIRSIFLASLLLMGDELDLHERRVVECLKPVNFKIENYPQESLMHIFKHHYITKVSISNNDSNICQIYIRFQFPDNSEKYRFDIVNSVKTKLTQQCQLTSKILQAEGLSWAEGIIVEVVEDLRSIRRPFPQSAISWLNKETCERRLVNRDELIKLLKKYINDDGSSKRVTIVSGINGSDIQYIIDWLICSYECIDGCNTVQIDFDQLLSRDNSYIENKTEQLINSDTRGFLIVSNLQYAENSVRNWLLTKHLHEIIQMNDFKQNIAVVFWEGDGHYLPEVPYPINSFELVSFSKEHVIDHLVRKRACPVNQALKHAHFLNPSEISPGSVVLRICTAFEGEV